MTRVRRSRAPPIARPRASSAADAASELGAASAIGGSSAASSDRRDRSAAIAAIGQPAWSSTATPTEPQARASPRRPRSRSRARARSRSSSRSSPGRAGPRPVRSAKAAASGYSARTCSRGSAASIARPVAVRCAGRRTPTSRDERGPARRALLDDVEHVAARHHGEVRALAGAVGERGEQRPTRGGRAAAGARSRRPSSNAAVPSPQRRSAGQVHDEAVLLERREQVVDARARHAELRRDRARRDRAALAREERQDAQRLVGGGHLGLRSGGGSCLA